ncbi:MAG TPA: helix-turn-helix domain-containing protein [Luteolibacter sp.]|nr:helix-turn-helix domain-containing protein [Luteolibacter sp.]
MKKSEFQTVLREVRAIERGEIAPGRVRKVTRLPDGSFKRGELDPETHRRKQARAWKAKTEAAKVRHELNLTQDAFAELLGVSIATVRKWERGIVEPSGAAKTLLAVAKLHPEAIRDVVFAK